MKNIKKAIRLIGLIIFMLLAAAGVGINGAIFPSSHRRDSFEQTIEMVESTNDDEEGDEVEKL